MKSAGKHKKIVHQTIFLLLTFMKFPFLPKLNI
ncbi:hypothetical protein I656_00180 [Geobacillus sp. WSUCF1]|nr:hypothetical protein I656_00180 [Geobacillus sp. WSUCF1]GAJ57606.1 hypothetical protein B23_0796 [Geobacillus thermoleovorans B23]